MEQAVSLIHPEMFRSLGPNLLSPSNGIQLIICAASYVSHTVLGIGVLAKPCYFFFKFFINVWLLKYG